MTAISQKILEGEVLSARDTVRIVGYLHPLKHERVDFAVPAGGTIAEQLEIACLGRRRTALPHHMVVQVNGVPVPQYRDGVDWWQRVRPRPGAVVTFFPRLTGDSTRAVLSIAIAVAAMVIAPYAAPALLAALPALGTLGVAQGVIGATIVVGGMLALNALFPVRQASLQRQQEGFKSLASIQGASNRINKYGSVPVVLGRHRYYPPFGTKPSTEIKGDDQYLRVLVIWGYGPLDVTQIKIGETPIAQFDDVETEHRVGYEADDDITLIPRVVNEEQLSVTLLADVENIRTTEPDTDEISVDITAPQGIYEVNNTTGAFRAREVTVEISYRLVGDTPWTVIDTVTFRRELETARKGRRQKVARGQYQVKVEKTSNDSASVDVAETVVWTALRSTTKEHPVQFPKPLCMTAFRIRATDQLSGVIDSINGVVQSLVTAFDGTDWNENTYSNNPADLYRHVLQGPAQARPKTDAEIDLTALQEWWQYCEDNGFTFNQVRDFVKGSWDVLADIAAAGRAVVLHKDGKWSVAWDKPDDVICQHFTPRNAWGFSGQKIFFEETHAWRVPFINQAKGWAEDERVVYDDGYDADNATKYEQIEFPGITSSSLAWKHGRFHVAQIRLRPETVSFNTDWESLIATRTSRIYLATPVLLIGQVSGQIIGSGTDGGTGINYIDVDEICTMEADKEYAIRWRTVDGSELRSVIAEVGEFTRLNISGFDDLPPDGALFSFGEAGRETAVYRVKEIENQNNLFARLTVVDDAPAISTADTGDIPDYDPGISDPVDPLTQAPSNLTVLEWIEAGGKSFRTMAKLSWQVPRFGKIASFHVQKRDDDAGEGWRNAAPPVLPPKTSADIVIEAAGTWSFRVRCIFSDGTVPSSWSTLESQELLGLLNLPSNITNLRRTYVSGNSTLDWDEINDARPVRYEVRRGETADVGMTVADQLTQPRYATVGDGTYWINAYVLNPYGERIYGAVWASAVLAESVLTKNVIVEHDEQVEGFTGALEGGVVDSGVIISDGSAIVSPWAQKIIDDIALTGERIFVYQSPHIIDIQRVESCPVSINWEGIGSVVGADFLALADILAQEDILGQASARFIRIIPVVRIAASGAADAFAPADVFDTAAVPDIFQAGVEWEAWRPFSPGGYKGRYFQIGMVGVSTDAGVNPSCPAFSWLIDVPDRIDHYSDLTVPVAGYAITFRPDGSATDAPFNGGPRATALPHISHTIIDGALGDRVTVTDLTVNGCTVHVYDADGIAVERDGVYIEAFGY